MKDKRKVLERMKRFFPAGLAAGVFLVSGISGYALHPVVAKAMAAISEQEDKHVPVPKLTGYTIPEKYRMQTVFFSGYEPGTIVIDPRNYFLYYVESEGQARRYGIAVGKVGLEFRGTAVVRSKQVWPRWTPTREMIERSPQHYARYASGMAGGPENPLGARALYLFQGSEDTYIRIHGTVQPWTIGSPASNGCFRMTNDDITDLYERVRVGTQVIVL